jgi:hypothetical protein
MRRLPFKVVSALYAREVIAIKFDTGIDWANVGASHDIPYKFVPIFYVKKDGWMSSYDVSREIL